MLCTSITKQPTTFLGLCAKERLLPPEVSTPLCQSAFDNQRKRKCISGISFLTLGTTIVVGFIFIIVVAAIAIFGKTRTSSVFKPHSKTELSHAIEKCLDQSAEGNCKGLYGPMGTWDVSSIPNMSKLFKNKLRFDQDLSSWKVSHVVDMFQMFFNAKSFNQDLNSWDVSHVTNITGMFDGAEKCNQTLHTRAWAAAALGSHITNGRFYDSPVKICVGETTTTTVMPSGTWSSWGACDMCLHTQERNCVTPPDGTVRSCKGQSQRDCSPIKSCTTDNNKDCCMAGEVCCLDDLGTCCTYHNPINNRTECCRTTTITTTTVTPNTTTTPTSTTTAMPSGTWSSWGACDMCLHTQERNCVTPPDGTVRSCKGQSQRDCSPTHRCTDDYGNNCCDQNRRCSVWTSVSAHGAVSQCCLSDTTFDLLVWPSNKSGLANDGSCCLGSLNSVNTDLVSAVDADGFCCLDQKNVSGVSKNGTCCIDAMHFSAVVAVANGSDVGNGQCCKDSTGMSAVVRKPNGCNMRGMCCGSVSLTSDGECCLDSDGEEGTKIESTTHVNSNTNPDHAPDHYEGNDASEGEGCCFTNQCKSSFCSGSCCTGRYTGKSACSKDNECCLSDYGADCTDNAGECCTCRYPVSGRFTCCMDQNNDCCMDDYGDGCLYENEYCCMYRNPISNRTECCLGVTGNCGIDNNNDCCMDELGYACLDNFGHCCMYQNPISNLTECCLDSHGNCDYKSCQK